MTGSEMNTRARRISRHSKVSTLADEPGSCQERTESILIGPSGEGAYAGGTVLSVPTMLQSRRNPVPRSLILRAKDRSAYRTSCAT